jgi:hypothetical protein
MHAESFDSFEQAFVAPEKVTTLSCIRENPRRSLSIRHDRRITLSGSVDHRWTGYGLSSVKSFIRRFVFDDFFLFSEPYETTENENGQGGVVLLSFCSASFSPFQVTLCRIFSPFRVRTNHRALLRQWKLHY